MKRLLLITGAAVGACAIAVPAAAGLSSNPSFSEHVPVRVPSKAQVVTFDDHGGASTTPRTSSPTSTSPTSSATPAKPRPTEPGDDHGTHSSAPGGTATHSEPGDDHGRNRHGSTTAKPRPTEPGDDHGTHSNAPGGTATHTEPGDDHHHGSTSRATTSAASGHGGKHGKDD